jgi:hypothetical protein
LIYGGREYAPNKAFLAGEVAMLLQSTSQVTTIERAAKFSVGTSFLPRIDGLPRGRSVIGGASLWVFKGFPPEEYDAVVKFFKYLAKPEVTARWHQETGYFPATNTAVKRLLDQGWFQENPNHLTAFLQILSGVDTPATRGVLLGNFVQIRDIVGSAPEKAFGGTLSPKARWMRRSGNRTASLRNTPSCSNSALESPWELTGKGLSSPLPLGEGKGEGGQACPYGRGPSPRPSPRGRGRKSWVRARGWQANFPIASCPICCSFPP